MTKAQVGTFEDLLEITEEALRPVVTALREVILEVDPNACEVVRLGDRAATYGVGPRKMIDGYAYILPYKEVGEPRVLSGSRVRRSRRAVGGDGGEDAACEGAQGGRC